VEPASTRYNASPGPLRRLLSTVSYYDVARSGSGPYQTSRKREEREPFVGRHRRPRVPGMTQPLPSHSQWSDSPNWPPISSLKPAGRRYPVENRPEDRLGGSSSIAYLSRQNNYPLHNDRFKSFIIPSEDLFNTYSAAISSSTVQNPPLSGRDFGFGLSNVGAEEDGRLKLHSQHGSESITFEYVVRLRIVRLSLR
jgi:hypothetical protein